MHALALAIFNNIKGLPMVIHSNRIYALPRTQILTIIWTTVYKIESKTNQYKFMIIVIQQNILDTCVIRSWSQVRDVHNHPCMYIVPNVRGKVCNCHHAQRWGGPWGCGGVSVQVWEWHYRLSKQLLKLWTWMAGLTLASDDSGSLATL